MDVTIVSQSYSATNWQQEVCHFQNALKSPSYFYPICFKLYVYNVDTRQMQTCERIIDILDTVAVATHQTLLFFFDAFETLNILEIA